MRINNRTIMSKRLNGLPHNIADSFFSSLRYYMVDERQRGYMADWVINTARTFDVREITLDVKHHRITPEKMNIAALRRNLRTADFVIDSELKANGFDSDFISEAEMIIKLDDSSFKTRFFYCNTIVVDKDGGRYEDSLPVSATEKPFDVSPPSNSFVEKLSDLGMGTRVYVMNKYYLFRIKRQMAATKGLRRLNQDELRVIDKLLEKDFPGRDAINEQLKTCWVEEWKDGSLSINIKTKSSIIANVIDRVPVEGQMEPREGGPIEILLHVVDGKVSELEIVTYGNPNLTKLPEPSQFKVVVRDGEYLKKMKEGSL